MTDAPGADEIQGAIWSYLTRWLDFVPDVDVMALEPYREAADPAYTHHAEMFLSYLRPRVGANADALREALGHVREGLASREILAGRIKDFDLEEEVPGSS